MKQAEAGPHIQFIYDVPAGRVTFVNAAYADVLGRAPAEVSAVFSALLARLHPDDRQYLARYWKLWTRGQMPDEVEIRCICDLSDRTLKGRCVAIGVPWSTLTRVTKL